MRIPLALRKAIGEKTIPLAYSWLFRKLHSDRGGYAMIIRLISTGPIDALLMQRPNNIDALMYSGAPCAALSAYSWANLGPSKIEVVDK